MWRVVFNMSFYDVDNHYEDLETREIERFERACEDAERRRQLTTGSIFDASEACGNNPWALNAYLANKNYK